MKRRNKNAFTLQNIWVPDFENSIEQTFGTELVNYKTNKQTNKSNLLSAHSCSLLFASFLFHSVYCFFVLFFFTLSCFLRSVMSVMCNITSFQVKKIIKQRIEPFHVMSGAMLESQTNPVGVELLSNVNAFFYRGKWLLAM